MKRRTDLYELIAAMSKSEKRYFTIDAQKSGKKGSRYLELFQAINEMEEAQEPVLRKKFGKNLSTDKNYLYEAILRSMRDYRSTNSLAARIREMILDAKYLSERGLYDQCEERLSNAKQLAKQLDDNLVLLEIIKEERQLIRSRRVKNYQERIKELSEDGNEVLRHLMEEMWYHETYEDLLSLVVQKFRLSDQGDIQELKERFYDKLLEKEVEHISPTSLRRRYQCWALYSQLVGNFEDVFKYYELVIDWWDKHALNKEEEFHKYIVDVSNYLHGYSTKGQFQYFPKVIESMEKSKPKNLHDKSLLFQKIGIYKLMYFINTGEKNGIQEFLSGIEKGLSTYFISQGSQFVLLINVAFLLFMQEDFYGCRKWCKKIIAMKKSSSRIDIQRASRLLYLISEFEIDDMDTPEKALRSVNRYFQSKSSQQGKSGFEGIILNVVQKLISAPIFEERHIYRSLVEDVKAYTQQQKVPLGMDEVVNLWAKGKIERKSIMQLLKQ